MSVFREITNGVEISVEPVFLEDQSNANAGQYAWAYRVLVANHGKQTITLRSRYWHITDGRGRVEEVEGEGVVGEQPTIEPGQAFRYVSGCPLPTSSGFMRGHYVMEGETGEHFTVKIPAFSLDCPWDEQAIH